MPSGDNSTAYWRRLVASITRRVQHACINQRGGGGRRYRVAAISVRPLASRTFLSAGTLSIGDKKGRMAKCSARNRIEYPWRRDVDHRVYTPGIWYLVRGSPNLFVCIGDGKGNMRGILSGVEGGMGRDLWDLFFSLFLLLLWFGKIACLGDYCYLFFLNILLKEGAFLQQIMTIKFSNGDVLNLEVLKEIWKLISM